ncbi:MAG: dihydrodipicolinate synthase family protein [Terracidiphilus sp.]|jgi:dihydrodipicolinate synthase/N-acetylneuraminate lyase
MLLEGVFAAVTTPFYPDERIYFRKIEANMARYSRSLLAGMVVLGSTGEAVTLNDAETRDVLRASIEATAPDKVLIAGVGRESVRATIELAEFAATLNYDAVVVRPPSYYRGQISPSAILHYFRSIADRSPLSVVLYHIPKFVPVEMPIELIAVLAQHPNIIGIKDSSGDVQRIRETVAATQNAPRRTVQVTQLFEAATARMKVPNREAGPVAGATFVSAGDLASGVAIATAPPAAPVKTRSREVGFRVLTGAERSIFAALEAGASGAIVAFAAFAPQACQEIYIAWKDHDPKLADEKQQRILAAGNRIVGAFGLAGIKYACDFNGYFGGHPRSPILPLTAEGKAEVEQLLTEIRN